MQNGVFLPTKTVPGVKGMYVLFQKYLLDTSFAVHRLKSLVKWLGFHSDFPAEANGLCCVLGFFKHLKYT